MLANRRYCYPLTVTDFASRYLLACEALSTTEEQYAIPVFERVFQEYGLPRGDPHRQRGALCVGVRALRAQQIVGLVVAPGYSASSASSQDIPNRTAGTSGCISP